MMISALAMVLHVSMPEIGQKKKDKWLNFISEMTLQETGQEARKNKLKFLCIKAELWL